MEGHPAPTAKLMAQYVQAQRDHFLPAYAPELNPDELVWNKLHQNGVSKKLPTAE